MIEELHDAVGVQKDELPTRVIQEGKGKGRHEEVATGKDEVPHQEGEGERKVIREESGEPPVHEDIEGDTVREEMGSKVRVGGLKGLSDVVHSCFYSTWC